MGMCRNISGMPSSMTHRWDKMSMKTSRKSFPKGFTTSFECGHSMYCRHEAITSMTSGQIATDKLTGPKTKIPEASYSYKTESRLMKNAIVQDRNGRLRSRVGRTPHVHVAKPRTYNLTKLASWEDKLRKELSKPNGPFVKIHTVGTKVECAVETVCRCQQLKRVVWERSLG